MGMNIPFFGLERQYVTLRDELLEATDQVLSSGQLLNGKFTLKFEQWLAKKCKAKYAVTINSCTQALEIMGLYYKEYIYSRPPTVKPLIRIPNLTYPATLNAFMKAGYDVELGDTDKFGIINSSPYSLICLVGLFGRCPWKNTWHNYTQSTSVIVDGAQHWLVADGRVGLGMAISFDPTKNLPSSGNGGAIVTNNEQLYLFAARYVDNNKPYFHAVGTNSKMSEQDCAQLLVRSRYIDQWQARRRYISDYWCDKFKDLPLNCLNAGEEDHANQKFVLYTTSRDLLMKHLEDRGISTRKHYEYVLGDLAVAQHCKKPDMLSTSVMLSRGLMSLPIYPELTDNEVEYIAESVVSFYSTK